ncbi:MAG TPA: HAMP domain-containing sensor histidine kinase [Actinomycetota bacterium]
MPTVRALVIVGALGAVATTATSIAFNMPAGEALELAAIAGGSAVLVGVGGTILLYALRRRPLGIQLTVVALASVAAVGAGAMAAAQAMFISRHDLHTLLVILLAAGTIGGLVALVLGRRVSAAGRSLGEAARRIGDGDLGATVTEPPTGEFAALARELDSMARRLDEARKKERALEASRRELTAWVSHDLRTPLAGIRAMAEALEDGVVEDPETVGRYYRTLRIESERLAHLVDELFELSVINAGALRLQMERVSLGDLVSDAISAAVPSARARGVRLKGQLKGAGPELELSPSKVARVLRNLLDNAIQHTPSDGAVWVEAGLDGAEAYVSVADECGGIPEPVLGRVFDLAFRGEPARTPGSDGGAGLGLAIARGIVEAHRGVISVRNHGPGCQFTVRLPLSQQA